MAKGVNIYRNGVVIMADAPITESAVHKATLMKEDYIQLSFVSTMDFGFKSGDYIRVAVTDGSYVEAANGDVYMLADDYYPTMDDEVTYRYELRFSAPWYNLSTYLLLFLTETPIDAGTYVTRRESEWEFTGTADELIGIIIKNTRLTGLYNEDGSLLSTRSCPCRFDTVFYCEPTEVKSFTFSSTDIISALNRMSNDYELEWWVERDGDVFRLHFGECDSSIVYDSDNATQFNDDGTRVKDASMRTILTMGENVSKPSVKQNEALKRYYFVYGSSRNIDQSITSLDINAIATKKLSLDNPIDKITGSGEEVVTFDDVYPKSDYQITRVDSYETESDTIAGYDSDGNPIYATYTIYQIYLKGFSDMVMGLIADDDNVQSIEDIVASGKRLSVKFITHENNGTTITPLLAGWEFEVGAVLQTDTSANQWYELQLLHQEINSYIVPNRNLYPRGVNDGLATDLQGNTTTIQGAGDAADWVCVFNIKGAYVDADELSNAKAELEDAFNRYYANKKKNISYTVKPYVDSELMLSIGDAVELVYGDEDIVTRVNSFNRHLDYCVDASYELCAYTNKGAVNSLKEEVKVLNAVVNRATGSGSIDANAVSNIVETVGDKRYLSRTKADTAAETITFLKGIVTDNVISSDFISGLLGFKICNQDGISYGEIDDLMVRRRAIFISLAIKEMRHIGGAVIISPASAKIEKVEEGSSGYKCYFKGTDGNQTIDNFFYRDDLVMCRTYSNNYNTRYYWRRCTSFSPFPDDEGYLYIVLSKTDCASDSDAPQAGDSVVTFGSKGSEFRQSVIILNSEGNNAPYFQQLRGINDYGITDANILTELGQQNNIIRGEKIELVTEDGNIGMDYMFSAIVQNAESITSVVSKQEAVGKEYTSSQWVGNDGFNYYPTKNTNEYYVVYSKDPQNYYDHCTRLTIENVKKGDKIHIEGKSMFIRIIGCDGDAQGADTDFGNDYPSDINDFTALGFGGDLYDEDGISVVDWVATDNWEKVYIMLTDDSPYACQTAKVTLIRSAYTAESRIEQTAENIKLAVGETGINIDAKTISLSASNTIVSGDLSVQRVNTYYPDGSLRSSFNGNGDGSIVYYYPNGQVMKEDCFVYNDSNKVAGMTTTYYDADGNPTWRIEEGGFVKELSSYWNYMGYMYHCDSTDTMQSLLKSFAQTGGNWYGGFDYDEFSKFISNTNYTDYNGRIAMGMYNSASPVGVEWYAGVLVNNVEMISESHGIVTYKATYTVVRSDSGLQLIDTYEFTNF